MRMVPLGSLAEVVENRLEPLQLGMKEAARLAVGRPVSSVCMVDVAKNENIKMCIALFESLKPLQYGCVSTIRFHKQSFFRRYYISIF